LQQITECENNQIFMTSILKTLAASVFVSEINSVITDSGDREAQVSRAKEFLEEKTQIHDTQLIHLAKNKLANIRGMILEQFQEELN
jgi:hypothetical protein